MKSTEDKSSRQVSLFDRSEEFSALKRAVVENRKSMLVFGQEGSGKSSLLRRLASIRKECLYLPHCVSPTDLLTGIISAMGNAGIAKSELKPSRSGIGPMRGIVQRGLKERDWILLLDHVQSPSPALAHLVRELNYYGRTPLAFAGRSQHMEDIGNFRTFCTDRSCRIEMKPWPQAVALEFTRQQAATVGLTASNLEETLKAIADMSRGHPGPILEMLRMAKQPAYQRDGQVKVHVVYLDYRLRGTRAPQAMLI
jgi:hypothetical protein